MPLHPIRKLDIDKPLVVRREFMFNGKAYRNGDPFEWDSDSIPLRKIEILFETKKLTHPDDADTVRRGLMKNKKCDLKNNKYELKHKGFGKWVVIDKNGNSINKKGLTKEKANELLQELIEGE